MTKDKIKAFFNDKAAVWDSICVHDINKIKSVFTFCGLKPSMRILDVACGTGVLEGILLEYKPERILAIDIAQRMIDVAVQKYHNEEIEFVCSDIFNINENGFDICFLYSSYPHFEDKQALLAHLAGRLKEGGRLVIFHSEGKNKINELHNKLSQSISCPLDSALETAELLSCSFSVDIIADTPELYVVSGQKL